MIPFLVAAAAGAAAIILTGCSKDTPEEEAKTPKEPKSSPAQNISFEMKCMTDSSCSPSSRLAAFYDYVGAVYGETGNVRYNSVLTTGERYYIEKYFGKLSGLQNSVTYLFKAQDKALQGQLTGDVCPNNSVFIFSEAHDPEHGEALIIGGAHINSVHQEAMNISNQLSTKKVIDLLAKHKKPKAFFQLGTEHLPLIENVYEKVESSPGFEK